MTRIYRPRAFATVSAVIDGLQKGVPIEQAKRLTINAIPTSVQVHKNSDNQADSFSVSFDAEDMPFFPGQILAAEVELFLYQIDDDGDSFLSGAPRKDRRTVLGRGAIDARIVEAQAQIVGANIGPSIIGLVDDASLNMGADGRTLELSGQDYTAHFQSVQWPPLPNGRGRRVQTGQRLDKWVESVLREVDPSGRLSVVTENVQAEDLPVVGAGFSRNNKNGITIEQDTKYWDVVHKVCQMHGYSAFIDGVRLVIRAARGADDQMSRKFYIMAWGVNVESVDASRKLGSEAAPRVVFRSFDRATGKVLEGSWPPDGSKQAKVPTAVGKQRTERAVLPPKPGEVTYRTAPAGIKDPARLQAMARQEREALAGGEQKMVIRTRDLRDISGRDGQDADLLRAKSGDVVAIELSQVDYAGVGERKTAEERTAYLESRGMSHAVASFIANNFDVITRNGSVFVIREISLDYSTGDGVSVEMELIKAVDPDSGKGLADTTRGRMVRASPVGSKAR